MDPAELNVGAALGGLLVIMIFTAVVIKMSIDSSKKVKVKPALSSMG